jgi:hypothetical protein
MDLHRHRDGRRGSVLLEEDRLPELAGDRVAERVLVELGNVLPKLDGDRQMRGRQVTAPQERDRSA